MEEWEIRLRGYMKDGFPEGAVEDEHPTVRFYAWKNLDFPDECADDDFGDTRLKYRLINEFSEDDKSDEFWKVRLYAYRALGWTEAALDDENEFIRLSAAKYLES